MLYPMSFQLMANINNGEGELTTSLAATLLVCVFILCILLTMMGVNFMGPYATAVIIGIIYAEEIFVSCITVRETMAKTFIWCSWLLHLCCALFLLGYLHRTGFISSGFEWKEEMGHGNFDYHQEPASCWNIFWWLGGIRLTVLQIFHLWWHR